MPMHQVFSPSESYKLLGLLLQSQGPHPNQSREGVGDSYHVAYLWTWPDCMGMESGI